MSSNLITVKLGLHLEKFTLLVCGELVKYVRKLRWGLGDAAPDGIADDIDYSGGKGNGFMILDFFVNLYFWTNCKAYLSITFAEPALLR